jgi:hypothetical protein
MALPLPPRNLNPIPNSPFYYPNEEALASSTGPLIVGAGLAVDYTSGQLQASTGGLANVSATLPLYKTGTVSNPVINIETANQFRLGAVQVGTNLNVSGAGVIDVLQSTTAQKGIVQLADNTSSTSKFLALTANQGYLLQQQINALSFATDLVFSGTFDPTVPEMVNVTTKGLEAGFVQGANLPLPAPENSAHFVIVAERGIYTPPGGTTPIDAHVGSWFLSNGTEWRYLKINEQVPYATESSPGVIRLATLQEAIDGVDDTAAITSCKMAQVSVEKCSYTAKGDILSATSAGTTTALPVGNDSQFLSANSACPEGLEWVDQPPAIPCSVIGNCGSIVVGSAPSTPTSLPIGLNNQFLRVNYNCPTSMEWVTVTNNFGIPCSILTSAGSLITATGPSSPVALPRGNDGQQLTVCSACTATGGLTWSNSNCYIETCYLEGPTFAQRCPRGSLIATNNSGVIATVRGAGDDVRYNGHALVSCTTSSTGLCWAEASPPQSCFTGTAGEIYVGTDRLLSSGLYELCALMPGTNGQILKIDDTQPQRVVWGSPWPATACEFVADGITVTKGNDCVYTLLPTTNYPVGTWMVTMWGSACNAGGSACMRFYFAGQPVQYIEYPNTNSEIPFSQTAFICNDPTTGNACWHSCNSSTGAGPQDVIFCAHMTAIRVG